MAVAPVVDGKVDTTQITIAYAGTNFEDAKDRQTDLNSVIGGQNYEAVLSKVDIDGNVSHFRLDMYSNIIGTWP
ncbi:hypothetical protein [Streptococcus suis]|uniref:hypothetical protein n=1 Tax=Streptococcus suis TaxID=1307 RepID=UPI00129002A1|nr:hypothetical protein [Streptococcus suis]